jgi:hypothetical protein
MTRQEMSETSITLDGMPAKVTGTRLDFAIVRSKVQAVEFAWATVERVIVNRGGAFSS